MRDFRFAWPGCALIAVAMPTAAFAQPRANAIPDSNGSGFDTHLFRPALDSRGLISVNGVDVLAAGNMSVGLLIDYGRGLLRVPDVGQQTPELVNDSFQGTVFVNYGILNRAIVGISAPLLLMSGDAQYTRGTPPAPAVAGWGPQQLDEQGLATVALHAKVKLTSPETGVGLAVAAQVGVPVSDAPKNAGADPSFWYWPMLIAEKRFGSADELRIAFNVGYRGHDASSTTLLLRDGAFRDGSRLTYGAGAALRLTDSLDAILETYGTYLLSSADAGVKPSNEALMGVKLFVEKSSFFVIGAGPRYTNGFEAADLRGVIGFTFEPPMGDRDGDGIRDDEDACPGTPGIHSSRSRQNGCPLDSDDDGIPDSEDACPFVKGVRSPDPKLNGCPPDRDKDGIPDSEDACPDVPGIRTNDPKTNGCPDRDHDGVPDAVDACPDTPGPPNPDPARNGCPDVLIGVDVVTVFDKITFRTGSAEILPESLPILDKVAKALNDHPELVLLEVAGHADERGGEHMNLALTQARVDSVVAALVARKVERTRLRAKGYGYYCPAEPGHDEAAWSKNRRVEFLIVKTTSGPTGVALGCPNAAAHGVNPAPVP